MANFESLPNRKGTRSVKWDRLEEMFGSKDVQPMWVADMDLEIAEPIKTALSERINHGIFGYTVTDEQLNDTVRKWLVKQHNWDIDPGWLIYSPGVLQTIHMTILTQTNPGDKVLIQTPVYHPFHSIIKSHQRELVTNPLIYQNKRYTIDFEDLEEKFKTGIKVMLFCSPHNPVGRVWLKEELTHILELAEKYKVLIISDEIHADLIYDPFKHIPLGSLDSAISEQIISCFSPTKTFNLAGLQASYAVIPDQELRNEILASFAKYGLNSLNTLGITGLEAAYQYGEEWLEQLKQLLKINRKLVEDTFTNREEIDVVHAEGTYLIWLDCRKMNLKQSELKAFMEEKAMVGLNNGITFGQEGRGFMRLNIASPTSYIKRGLDKIIVALDQL
ncbi:MalY/PatB family protein [Amphibacillus sp. Q70]|uniref:MalY/PatB family protein n=1 Tax=Amphibacillus sp. Q70 TaxID=3453416 RepID=UPI003F86126F